VALAFRQQDRWPAFFHRHQHIVNDQIVSLFIGYQRAVEFLNSFVGRPYRKINPSFLDDKPMVKRTS